MAVTAFAQPLVSPEVYPDGRVTVRLSAPQAREVRLRAEGLPETLLQKDDNGVWSFTSTPLKPDIYVYSFVVDGVRTIDPSNPLLKYNLLNTESQVHVPGPASLPWELNDVPHGQVHHHFFKSTISGEKRDFYVYTPPGYQPGGRKRYPVLYLLHGYSDDASAWSTVGRANLILDNLLACKQAQPMVVVMPLGYGTMEIVKRGWQRVRDPELWQRNQNLFSQMLLQEVMPQAEAAYRTSAKPADRAIAGLSMGGAQSLFVGLNHPERFSWIGAFSSGGLSTNLATQFPAADKKLNQQLRLLWISCGEEDRLLKDNLQVVEFLKAKDVRLTWRQTEGAHSFRVWRRNLAELAPLLFK